MMYEKTKFDNGLRLVSKRMSHMASASLGIWLGVGGRYERGSDKGIAHLLEHLSFKGSKKYSARQIKEAIEGLGGSLNAFTSEELTCYLVKILSNHLYLAIDILADMVLSPLLDEKDLKKEKAVIVEEIKMYRDLPQSYVHELLEGMLWPKHPLGMNLAGTIESVSSISKKQLADFHGQFYHPGNMVVSVCGRIEHNRLSSRLARLFSRAAPKASPDFKKAEATQQGPKTNLFYKETEQSHLAMGYPSFRRDHPDRHALWILHVILGANMSSRLFNEVREKKGLAYEIGTQVRRFHDTGAFIIHAGVDNRKVHLAISTILKEISKISQSAVSQEEFSRAKEYYTGQLLMSLEDTLDHMVWLGEQEVTSGRIKSAKDILSEINKVGIKDLKRVAGLILRPAHLNLALIGPQTEKEKQKISRLL